MNLGAGPLRLPARVALTDAQRTCSPRRASTRACTSRAWIGWRSSTKTLEMASMIRPCRGCPAPTDVTGAAGARVRGSRLVSRPVLGRDGTPPSRASIGAGGLEWCPLRSTLRVGSSKPIPCSCVAVSAERAAGVVRRQARARRGDLGFGEGRSPDGRGGGPWGSRSAARISGVPGFGQQLPSTGARAARWGRIARGRYQLPPLSRATSSSIASSAASSGLVSRLT